MSEYVFESRSLADTARMGRTLGAVAQGGLVVALEGPLGSGKTTFVRAVAQGLGIADESLVASPTFVLIHEYAARLAIYHFDAYRLAGPADFSDLGPSEYFEGEGVSLVEWADRVESALPADRLVLRFEVTGDQERRIYSKSLGPRSEEVLRAWRSRLGNGNKD